MKTVKLGSLYFNGTPVGPGAKFYQGIISIGETVPRMALTWNVVGSKLVANQVVCDNISWNRLCEAGYTNGHPVQIGGKFYLCRSLRVGKQTGDPNEWDELLDRYGEDDNLWHWLGTAFWGQEARLSMEGKLVPPVRGGPAARTRYFCPSSNQTPTCGFRPVLEPLGPSPALTQSLIGKKLKVYGPDGARAEGILRSFDAYDMELEYKVQPVEAPCFDVQSGFKVIVNREAIMWFGEVHA